MIFMAITYPGEPYVCFRQLVVPERQAQTISFSLLRFLAPGDRPRPVIDERPGYAESWRQVREVVPVEPCGTLDLDAVQGNFSALVIGNEREHEWSRERPRFTCKVPEILDRDSRLLTDLAVCGIFDRLAGLDKSGDEAAPAGRRPHPRTMRMESFFLTSAIIAGESRG